MVDLNRISVIGRTTREIGEKDYGYTSNGKARLNLSVAVNDGYGENKTVSYFDVVYWGKPAEAIKAYITKGKQLAIDGRLKQDRWEKDGQKHSRVTIVADEVRLLGGKSESDARDDDENPRGGRPRFEPAPKNGAGDFPEDIPF